MSLCVMTLTAVMYLINSKLGALLLLIAAAYYMFLTKGSLYERLLKVIVYSSAYYSFDIFGGRQRLSLCIVCVAILCILLTFNMMIRGARVRVESAVGLILLTVFLGAYGLSIWGSRDSVEAVFMTYHLVLLAYLVFIIPIAKNEELVKTDTESLLKLYIKGICAVAITLYIQYAAKTVMGMQLGAVYEYNSDRVIYNVYFLSKSVLSLYFAVGMLYYFVAYVNEKKLSALVWIAVFGGATLLNNSRTGLVCFAMCAALYCLRNMRKIVSSVRVIAVLILVGAAGLWVVNTMLASRASLNGFVDDNGRFETIIEAVRLLPRYIFAGIGGSARDYLMSSMGVSVHNFFVAYLVQFGIFGGLAVNMLVMSPLVHMKSRYWYYLCCVVMGGMFFANWHNVLYIVPLYLCLLLENRATNKEKQIV